MMDQVSCPLHRASRVRRQRLVGFLCFMVLFLVGLAGPSNRATAHEMRPSLLTIREDPDTPGLAEVRWSLAFANGRPLPIEVVPDARCRLGPWALAWESAVARTTHASLDCRPEGLDGVRVHVRGLDEAGTDVVVRIVRGGGTTSEAILTARSPSWDIPPSRGTTSGLGSWLGLGVKHLITGWDHLLFAIGLLLVAAGSWRTVFVTISGFTLGHSVTLALAAFGLIPIRVGVAEAWIALSILLLGAELAERQAAPGDSLLMRKPWLVSTACGLLHGLGFAGVLMELGLPKNAAIPALVLFNLGLEVGQLTFVFGFAALLALLPSAIRSRVELQALPRIIGIVGAYWAVERTVALFG